MAELLNWSFAILKFTSQKYGPTLLVEHSPAFAADKLKTQLSKIFCPVEDFWRRRGLPIDGNLLHRKRKAEMMTQMPASKMKSTAVSQASSNANTADRVLLSLSSSMDALRDASRYQSDRQSQSQVKVFAISSQRNQRLSAVINTAAEGRASSIAGISCK